MSASGSQYLTQSRMLLATQLLRGSNAPLVRYQTDTALSRAFRREFGAPPAAWRKTQVARNQVV
jgi:AraC-like DNA-binding protein